MRAVLEVLQAGLFTSFQDMGRNGMLSWAVSVGGAMDKRLAAQANLDVGNNPEDAVLEFAIIPGSFRAMCTLDISFRAVRGKLIVDGDEKSCTTTVVSGQEIKLKQLEGRYAYLAVKGGFVAEKVFKSVSFHQISGIGGGKIRKGQELYAQKSERKKNTISRFQLPVYNKEVIRCYRGVDFSLFDNGELEAYLGGHHTIDASSNRMGIVLKNRKPMKHNLSIISSPVLSGTIQLPPRGQGIIVGKDGQSIGGYPRIAKVVREDFAILAQKMTDEKVTFILIE